MYRRHNVHFFTKRKCACLGRKRGKKLTQGGYNADIKTKKRELMISGPLGVGKSGGRGILIDKLPLSRKVHVYGVCTKAITILCE